MNTNSIQDNLPIPLTMWEKTNVWPTRNVWYHMLKPEQLRDELMEAGVCNKVNGRWVIFPANWQQYCAKHHRPHAA